MRSAGRGGRTPLPALQLGLELALVLPLVACASSGQTLQIQKVDAVSRSPSNVALYLKVARTEDGEPVQLAAGDFAVYEDGKLVPAKKAKRALLPSRAAVDRVILVVVNFSGPIVDSEYMPTLLDAVAALGKHADKQARVAMAAFDGDAGLVDFVGPDDADPAAGMAGMRRFRPRSRNTDLWGAFLGGLDEVEGVVKKSPLRHTQATLIVVTDRGDKAGRHTRLDALARVGSTAANVFVIGIGSGVNQDELAPLGKAGAWFIEKPRDIDKSFSELGAKLDAERGHDYVFSYCSPKRQGMHKLELRISTATKERGRIQHEFDAEGFAKGCTPTAKALFQVEHDDEDAKDKEESAEKVQKPHGKKPAEATGDGAADDS